MRIERLTHVLSLSRSLTSLAHKVSRHPLFPFAVAIDAVESCTTRCDADAASRFHEMVLKCSSLFLPHHTVDDDEGGVRSTGDEDSIDDDGVPPLLLLPAPFERERGMLL